MNNFELKTKHKKTLHQGNVLAVQDYMQIEDYTQNVQENMQPEYAINQQLVQQLHPIQENRGEQERLNAKKEKKKLQERRKKETGLPLDMQKMSYTAYEDGKKYKGDMKDIKDIKKSDWGRTKWLQEKHNGFTNQEILQKIKRGDHSQFENLDTLLRDYLAMKEIQKFNEKYLNGYSPEDKIEANDVAVKAIVDKLEEEKRFFDPVMRLGLSQFANLEEKINGKQFKSIYRAVDNEIAKRIMVRTLTYKMSEADKIQYCKRIKENQPNIKNPEEELERQQKMEKAKRAQMAKQLLLMHMGRLQIVTKGEGKDIDVPMASVLAHCSRVMIITPRCKTLTEENGMWASILRHYNGKGEKYTNDANIESRAASTHSLETRKTTEKFGKEKKKLIIAPNFLGQTGMNVAIGGMGSSGVDGKMIDQDGSCGHVYGMHKISNGSYNGAYLFGYESDSTGHTNQLGHKHTARAVGEKASSFLCHRTDEIGDKYGGRQADVSKISPKTIAYLMSCIDELFDKNDDMVKTVSEKLCGGYMEHTAMNDFIKELVIHTKGHQGMAIQTAWEVVDLTRPIEE